MTPTLVGHFYLWNDSHPRKAAQNVTRMMAMLERPRTRCLYHAWVYLHGQYFTYLHDGSGDEGVA